LQLKWVVSYRHLQVAVNMKYVACLGISFRSKPFTTGFGSLRCRNLPARGGDGGTGAAFAASIWADVSQLPTIRHFRWTFLTPFDTFTAGVAKHYRTENALLDTWRTVGTFGRA
jgi:hypothetical protein